MKAMVHFPDGHKEETDVVSIDEYRGFAHTGFGTFSFDGEAWRWICEESVTLEPEAIAKEMVQ